jgi:hypothetical protein
MVDIIYPSVEINKLTLMGVYPHGTRKSVSGQGLVQRKGANPQAFPHREKPAV